MICCTSGEHWLLSHLCLDYCSAKNIDSDYLKLLHGYFDQGLDCLHIDFSGCNCSYFTDIHDHDSYRDTYDQSCPFHQVFSMNSNQLANYWNERSHFIGYYNDAYLYHQLNFESRLVNA